MTVMEGNSGLDAVEERRAWKTLESWELRTGNLWISQEEGKNVMEADR